MPKQYSFKTTRRTGYLEEVLESIPLKDRSEVLRQALSLGLIQMGLLNDNNPMSFMPLSPSPINETKHDTKDTPTFHESETSVKQVTHEGTTNVEQVVHKGLTKGTQLPPEITVIEVDNNDAGLEDTLDNINF